MRLDDLLGDGKAQAGPFFILAAGQIGFVETVPDQLQAVLGDADAAVLDGNEYLCVFFRGLDLDDGIVVGKFDGIVQEVVEHLLDLSHIRVDIQLIAREHQFDGDPLLLAGSLKGSSRVPDYRIQIKIRFFQNHSSGIQVIQGKKAVGQLGQPVGFVQDDMQIFFIHLRRNRSVQHGLQIAVDGGQRGAEIVGDVGDEFFLVVLAAGDFIRHVGKGGGQIPHFIFTVYLNLVMHVSGGVLLRGLRDFPEGQIDHFREENQDDQGEQKQDDENDVGNAQDPLAGHPQVFHGGMDDHITAHLEIGGDGGEYAEHILVKAFIKIPHRIVGAGKIRCVEILNNTRSTHINRGICVQNHAARRVNNPDDCVQIKRQGIHLRIHRLQINLVAVQVGSVGVRNQRSLLIQRVCLFPFHMFLRHAGAKGGDHDEAEEAENQIGEQEFQVEGFPHCLTSNL